MKDAKNLKIYFQEIANWEITIYNNLDFNVLSTYVIFLLEKFGKNRINK